MNETKALDRKLRFGSWLVFVCLCLGCQTTADVDNGKVYLSGTGVAKYHLYDGVRKCKTAFGLDPDAFDQRVTALSMQIHAKFPQMTRVGKRGGPYDPSARCVRVKEKGKDKAIVVRAIDKCCGKGSLSDPKSHQLDLAADAFEALAPLARGNLTVEWALVDCPASLSVTSDGDVCDDNFYFTR